MKFRDSWCLLSDPQVVGKVYTAAMEVIKARGEVCKPPRKGGCLCVADAETGEAILLFLIGHLGAGKTWRFISIAQEKAKRLAEMRRLHGHITSMQSRDPDVGKYGGAILLYDGLIMSFSGLQEEDDELLSRHVAGVLGFVVV